MILLDTNVVSEVLRPAPHPNVVAWMKAQPRQMLCTSTLVQAEILFGLRLLPDGKRRTALTDMATRVFAEFESRILPFSSEAAEYYAIISATRRKAGHTITGFDALIGATARAANAQLATRNMKDFQGCGLDLVNPWEER